MMHSGEFREDEFLYDPRIQPPHLLPPPDHLITCHQATSSGDRELLLKLRV